MTDDLPAPPRNLFFIVEYDGSAYVGWERQKNGLAVQQVIEDVIERITGDRVFLNASGRTDTGVHALGQAVSFTTTTPMSVGEVERAMNALLPPDIAVRGVREAPITFHARFSATGKVYRYGLLARPIRSVFDAGFRWHIRSPLDLAGMRRAARDLVGRHDFTSFCKEPDRNASCVRTIARLDISDDGPRIDIEVEGDGFLYNMVRIIVGTLVDVGRGRIAADAMERILDARDRTAAGVTAPPHGLMLVRVIYAGEFHG